MSEIKETILTGYPNIITFDCTKEILNQMEKKICKIKIGEEQGTGFFCKIPFPTNEKYLKALITNNHVIDEDILYKKDQKISIYIKDKKEIKFLNLNDRIKYSKKEEEYDTTIIEIKDEDEITDFLELDEKIIDYIINNKNDNDDYVDKTIYIIQYPESELSVSYGIIQKICLDKKYKFTHKCSTKGGSSGSPILNLKNKVIGIHSGGDKNFNLGRFLNYPIKDFIKKYFYYNNDDKSIIDYKINEIILNQINNKFNLDIKDIHITGINLFEKYFKNDGIEFIKEIGNLFFYYQNIIKAQLLDFDFHKKIIEQMKKSICKIIVKYNLYGTGFFCKIPFPDKNRILKVLITNWHVVSDIFRQNENNRFLKIYNEYNHDYKELNLVNRKNYLSKEYDTAIIEIKEEDEITNYLELDDNIIDALINENNKIEVNKDYGKYLIQYSKRELLVSFGMIEMMKEDKKYKFEHRMETDDGYSSGSPIFNLNNKLIGIHSGSRIWDYKIQFGEGYFLNYPIKQFIEKFFNNNSNNKITIKEHDKKNNILFEERYNKIKKYLGNDIFKELNEFFLLYKIKFESGQIFDLNSRLLELNFLYDLLNEMNYCVCKIKMENKQAIGFFCKIPFPNENIMLPVLITNNKVINKEMIKQRDYKITIEIKKEKKIKELNLNYRKKYTSELYNTTIIEIKKEDQIEERYFELDEFIIKAIINNNEELDERHFDEKAYMINKQLEILTLSHISHIRKREEKTFLFGECCTMEASLGAPIFTRHNKLIGIFNKKRNFYNILDFTLLNYPIKEFIYEFYNSNNINEIDDI